MQVTAPFRRNFRPGKRLLSNAGLLCLGSALALNASATLAPTAGDTHVNGASNSSKNQNYGNANNLQVSQNMTSLLRFDIGTLPAGTIGLDVEKATLSLWVNNVATAGSVTVYALASPWTESTVTFNTQPGLGAVVASVPISAAMERQYISIDVTAQVRAWLDTAGSNHGFALRPTAVAPTTAVTFDSKENVGIPAMLDITLLSGGVAGPQGPAGPMGATGPTGPTGVTGAIGPVGATGPMGATGAAGATGATGATGAMGATGPAGPQGPTGAAGAAGADGKTVLNGAAAPLPMDGTDGDFYLDTSTNVLFGPKALGVWPVTGVALVGLAGAQGPAGPSGATGPAGPAGATGATGATGPTGPAGATGATGATGAAGATGATGATGLTGPQGSTGVTGAAGADGRTILNGAAAPLPADGTDGDFYVNTSTNVLFGPKALGIWPPTGLSLVGPAGAQGPAGTNGTDGATGATGAQGPQGATGATGASGLPGATGATGAQGLQGLTGATGAQGAAGLQGPQGATGPQGPIGLSSTYSIAVDINNNVVPFGYNQLIAAYTLTNSEGIVARVASTASTLFLKPGELVNRQPLIISGMGTLYFMTAGCTGNVGYVSGSSVNYTTGNGIATLDAPTAVNTPVNVSFWRYDMATAPTLNLDPVSMRVASGTCQTSPPNLTSALKMDRGASLTFLNALWPVTP